MGREITVDDFRQWVLGADSETLEEFLDEVLWTIENLEQDDFFGTEGFNKRYA
jgi:hypothetical protein